MWSAEQLTRPTFRNLDDSFEGWAYRNGFLRQIAILEREQFIARRSNNDRVYRLTAKGCLHAVGGRNPKVQWGRVWDGRWRLVLFDLPVARNADRTRLRKYLRNRGFGYLQNSVWITPDQLTEEKQFMGGATADVKSLIFFEARSCADESNAEIVNAAWDFTAINNRYQHALEVLGRKPTAKANNATQAKELRRWAEQERSAWNDAIHCDPLLPSKLLPSGYLGQQAWRKRIKVLRAARRELDRFKL